MFSRSYDQEVRDTLRQKRRNAKERGLECTINLRNIQLLKSATHCYYTGVKLSTKKNKFSIERIDSAKGYIPGNVIPVSTVVNQVKNNFTNDELRHMINVSLPEKIDRIHQDIEKRKLRFTFRCNQARYLKKIKNKSEEQIIELNNLETNISFFEKELKGLTRKLDKHKQNLKVITMVLESIDNKPFMHFDFMTISQKIAYVGRHLLVLSAKNVLFEFTNFKLKGLKNVFGHLTSNV